MVGGMAVVAACWASMLALHFKTQSASPLMQAGMLALIFLTPAYAPMALLQGWLETVARVNPVTQVLEAARQGPEGITWADTWPGIVAVAGMATLLGFLALREMRAARRCERGANKTPQSRSPSGSCARTGWKSRRRGRRFAYTRPSPGRYPWQWFWDSCFAAIVWRRFDPGRARSELESRLSAQRENGFVGHTIFWDRRCLAACGSPSTTCSRATPSRPRRSSRRCSPGPGGSRSATPPRSRGSAPRWTGSPPTATSRGTGCSGSSSPTSRASTPRPSSTPCGDGGPTPGSAFRCWCAATASSASMPAGSATAAGRSSARSWSTRCGRSRCRRWAAPRRPRPWSSGSGTSGSGPSSTRRSRAGTRPPILTCAALAPLALPDLPEEIGRRLVEEHLLDRGEFLTPVAPPSVAASEPSYEPGGGRGPIRRYWRGPTWVNTAWLAWIGLRRLGYGDAARELAAGLTGAVEREGASRVLRPADRQRTGREGLRLVGAHCRDGRTRSGRGGELFVAISNSAALQVVGRELDLHAVAGEDADVMPSHLSRDVAQHLVLVVEFDAEHRVGEGLGISPSISIFSSFPMPTGA